MPAVLTRLLTSPRLNTRSFALWGLGVGANLTAWAVGYFLLPEAALRGILPGGRLVPDGGGITAVFLPIFFYNAVVSGGIVVVANLFRAGTLPLGYVPVLINWTLYGLFLGTNSFDIARPVRPAPSLATLLGSPGFVELTAFTFLATATAGLFVYRQRSVLSWRAERVRAWREVRLTRCESATLAAAILMLGLSAYLEAADVLQAVG